jgi:hypothetical protein
MRARSIGLAFAALLVLGRTVPGHAQDAASKPAATPSTAPTEAPASVARPAITPNTAEPAPATTEQSKPRKHRRHARHHYKRYAHWQPFPIYLPRFHRHRISWHRIRWFF